MRADGTTGPTYQPPAELPYAGNQPALRTRKFLKAEITPYRALVFYDDGFSGETKTKTKTRCQRVTGGVATAVLAAALFALFAAAAFSSRPAAGDGAGGNATTAAQPAAAPNATDAPHASLNLTFAGGVLRPLCPDATLDELRRATNAHMSPVNFLLTACSVVAAFACVPIVRA